MPLLGVLAAPPLPDICTSGWTLTGLPSALDTMQPGDLHFAAVWPTANAAVKKVCSENKYTQPDGLFAALYYYMIYMNTIYNII